MRPTQKSGKGGCFAKVSIHPSELAFDIDGVIADTMTLFLDIAREEFRINSIRYEDITCYRLEDCLDIDKTVIDTVVTKIVNGDYGAVLRPFQGAADVLKRLVKTHCPLLFVTARPYNGPIQQWIEDILALDSKSVEIVATGSFDDKAQVLIDRHIAYFVEDRLETCYALHEAGVTPIVFKQPWNRGPHPFMEVGSWSEMASLIALMPG